MNATIGREGEGEGEGEGERGGGEEGQGRGEVTQAPIAPKLKMHYKEESWSNAALDTAS